MNSSISRRTVIALAASALLTATGVHAQSSGPMRVILPIGAGSGVDTIMRAAQNDLSKALGGQPVVIENLPGAGGITGTQAVVKAAPDGNTVGVVSNNHAVNPSVFKKLPYDSINDLTPISVIGGSPFVLVVNPELPAKTVQELIALLKAEPDKYSYASSGNGTPLHLSGELFKSMAGVSMQHIPYKGAGPALNDVIGNQVPIMFDNLPSSSSHIKAGTLRALAVTTAERAPSFPDVPTVAESGIPGYETYTWNALFAPAKTPNEVVMRLNASAKKALADPAVAERMKEFSATIVGSTPEELAAHVKAELAKWGPVVKGANIQME
jgi:tripartite-type tricarboxylate transporter receptor subunit TctC